MTLFRNWLQREIDTLEAAPSGASVAGLTPAVEVTTEVIPNLVTGDGDLTVVVIPAEENAILGVKVAGEDAPRMYIVVGDGDTGIWMSDGTRDPYDDGGGAVLFDGTDLRLSTINDGVIQALQPVKTWSGVQVRSPDGAWHQITIANDGTVSSETV